MMGFGFKTWILEITTALAVRGTQANTRTGSCRVHAACGGDVLCLISSGSMNKCALTR